MSEGANTSERGVEPTYIEAVLRQVQSCPMTFEELVKGCTEDEREQLAWHLAQMRARRTYEALRHG